MPKWLKLVAATASVGALVVAAAVFLRQGQPTGVGGIPSASPSQPTSVVPQPSTATVTITFSASACEVAGADALSTGPTVVRSVNARPDYVTIDVWRFHPDLTYEDFAAEVAIDQARIAQGLPLRGATGYPITMSTGALLETSGTEETIATLPAGTHAITCIAFADKSAFDSDRALELLVAGPIEVSK